MNCRGYLDIEGVRSPGITPGPFGSPPDPSTSGAGPGVDSGVPFLVLGWPVVVGVRNGVSRPPPPDSVPSGGSSLLTGSTPRAPRQPARLAKPSVPILPRAARRVARRVLLGVAAFGCEDESREVMMEGGSASIPVRVRRRTVLFLVFVSLGAVEPHIR